MTYPWTIHTSVCTPCTRINILCVEHPKTQVLTVKRRMCLRNLGRIYLDERKSLTELRATLKNHLEKALSKAAKQVAQEAAARAAEQATAAAAAADITAVAESAAERASAGEDGSCFFFLCVLAGCYPLRSLCIWLAMMPILMLMLI